MNFKYIYKVCTKTEWLEAKKKGKFYGSNKDLEDGFIHFSNKDQLKGTLNKYFLNQRDLVLLKIEALKLDNLVYEQASDGNVFPHLYSYLNTSHVCNEYEINIDKKGNHSFSI
tara:strand:- start:1283 stop:1621 length:339 start_codon:yes stop_codon:yes gene_type:complete